jgi:aspartyl-tRNA(Asn)/glutamyl-tRNA(Gln) amidotransferase subunit C
LAGKYVNLRGNVATIVESLVSSVYCQGTKYHGGGMIMSRISEEQVKHVAHLARLAVTEEEVTKFTKQLDAIITFAEQLNELDTDNVEPTTHVLKMRNIMRKDVAEKGLPVEEVLKNAPDHQAGQVRVPTILE